MAEYRLSDDDFDRWAERGVITAQQRDAILGDLRSRPRDEGLTVTILAYYAGGLLILIAYGIFLGVQWEQLASGARVFISGASIVFFAVVSQVLLRSRGYRLPGELLQVVAVAVVPLLMFSALDASSIWPDDPGSVAGARRLEYQSDLTWMRMALGDATLVAAAGAFWLSRSPFVLVALVMSIASLALDATIQARSPTGAFEDYNWGIGQSLTLAALGSAALGAGVYSRGGGARDYATWFYIMGLAGLAVGLGSRTFDSNAPGWGALWMATAAGVLVASIPLQQRLFAAAGLAAVFAYLAKLVFDVFESANAALALIVLGLLVLGAGMLYQRLTERAYSTATPRPSPPADSSVH